MSETKTYIGSCHCGAVTYEADADLRLIISCNCSICRKRGLLLAFVPEEAFRLTRGEENLTDYTFNKGVVHHLFCSKCGVGSFGRGTAPDGTKTVAINVRCLDGINPDELNIRKFDGASL